MNFTKALSVLALATCVATNALAASPVVESIKFKEVKMNLTNNDDVVASRTYYNGKVRIAEVYESEPASHPSEIFISVPNGYASRQHRRLGISRIKVLSVTRICSVEIKKAQSSYDSKEGLSLEIPVMHYDPNEGCTIPDTLHMNIAMTSGNKAEVSAFFESGRPGTND